MTQQCRQTLSQIFALAWQFVKRNGFTISEALKIAWRNVKLRTALHKGIVKFYFQKVDGTLREAYGTLADTITPATNDHRRPCDTTQVYYDTEKQAWRCFKKANLVSIA